MPIALAIGVEPALMMAAVCKLPTDRSELDLAGALQGKPIDLVTLHDVVAPAEPKKGSFKTKIRTGDLSRSGEAAAAVAQVARAAVLPACGCPRWARIGASSALVISPEGV